jgi:hypothetical protein
MHLIEILLPLADNTGARFPPHLLEDVHQHLIAAFGGATAFTRAPAVGASLAQGKIEEDEIVIFEVMTDQLDTGWWREYRANAERTFQQREIVIRSHEVTLL